MQTVGVICEYNPFHLGHQKQLREILTRRGSNTAIVCLMSGNYVQRGAPALLDKSLRARAALRCGADLVLELPLTAALSSAEGFAAGGVGILEGFCDELCFGAEDPNPDVLLGLARALLGSDFPPRMRTALKEGLSFPAARQKALEQLGYDGSLLEKPNNILAVEYCKAILSRGSALRPFPLPRTGSHHAQRPDGADPSAAAVRAEMLRGNAWQPYVPEAAQDIFTGATFHTLAFGERAVLARLRSMNDAEFEALPYGSEGLWRKLMFAARSETTLGGIAAAVKSKRYTRTRIDRMILCAFLGLTLENMLSPVPYIRVLGLNDTGRAVLKRARDSGVFLNAGEPAAGSYAEMERRAGALYGLFAADAPEKPDIERCRRVVYVEKNHAPQAETR